MASAVSFLRQAFLNPRSIASIAPSGPALTKAIAACLPDHVKSVVEFGPGTGPVTKALLDRGISPHRLLAVERNRQLGLALRRKFPKISTNIADAQMLPFILRDSDWPLQVDAIVSSLGLRAMTPSVVEDIARTSNRCLRIGGVFVQYSYMASSPIPENLCRQLGWDIEVVGRVWRNLPPATIYKYTKR